MPCQGDTGLADSGEAGSSRFARSVTARIIYWALSAAQRALCLQADQHVKEIERLAAEAQQKHDTLTEVQATITMLEAAKVATTALHSAQLADAAAATAGAVRQEREAAAAREKALLDTNSDLKTELGGCKDAAAEAQRRHEAVLAELQESLTGTLEEVERQKQVCWISANLSDGVHIRCCTVPKEGEQPS